MGSTLVLGGARSGKSTFAEEVLRASKASLVYVATATAGDAEMAARIALHQRRRDLRWRTIEEPLALVDTLKRPDLHGSAILVDCLTLWLSNLMHADFNIAAETERLAEWLRRTEQQVALVSNEVGLGLVPETALGREFRDAQGQLNQAVAASVDRVVFMAAGLPLWLKGSRREN